MIYTHSAFDQLSVCALKKGENNRQRDLRHCSVDKDGARAAESVLGGDHYGGFEKQIGIGQKVSPRHAGERGKESKPEQYKSEVAVAL